jgi:hypothetical protein
MVHAEKDWAFISLCDDGSMWLYHGSWSRRPSPGRLEGRANSKLQGAGLLLLPKSSLSSVLQIQRPPGDQFGESRLDNSRNALSHRCDITAKNLADFAQLRKEHVMGAALDLAVAILIQPAFCR